MTKLIPGRLYSIKPEENIPEKLKRKYWDYGHMIGTKWGCYSVGEVIGFHSGLPDGSNSSNQLVMFLAIYLPEKRKKKKPKKQPEQIQESGLRFAKVLYKDQILIISTEALEEIKGE